MPSFLRSEPAQRIATNSDKGSTSTENYKDKVTLSEVAVEKSRRGDAAGTEEASTTAETGPEKQGGQRPEIQKRTAAEERIVRQLQERELASPAQGPTVKQGHLETSNEESQQTNHKADATTRRGLALDTIA